MYAPYINGKIQIKSTFAPLKDRDNYVKHLRIDSMQTTIDISFNQDKTIMNCVADGIDCTNAMKNLTSVHSNYIPRLILKEELTTGKINAPRYNHYSEVVSEIKLHAHGRLERSTVYNEVHRIQHFASIMTIENFLAYLKQREFGSVWKDNAARWTTDTKSFRKIYTLLKVLNISESLYYIEECLEEHTTYIYYIAPVRATAERYYRFNDISINEIAPDGGNISMYLHNMTDNEKKLFREWTLKHFSFQFYSRSRYGHISITVNDGNEELNLADTGFGYSQILPILIHLWRSQDNRQVPRPEMYSNIFAIEQPELHLYPNMIGKLTDALCSIANECNNLEYNNKIILETHSSTLVDKIGINIINNTIDHNDVSVVLFEREDPTKPTKIRQTKYNKNGHLESWPAGFLCADL